MSSGIIIYDGATCIGGNEIYLDSDKKGIFLDFGKNFGKYGRFYEYFLKSRTTGGIHDLLHLGLILRLNIYHPNIIPDAVDLISPPSPLVSNVLLSRAKMIEESVGETSPKSVDVPIGLMADIPMRCFEGLLDIKPVGEGYLYSSCESFSEERKIDFHFPTWWLTFFGICAGLHWRRTTGVGGA
jgi:hypothetical protein